MLFQGCPYDDLRDNSVIADMCGGERRNMCVSVWWAKSSCRRSLGFTARAEFIVKTLAVEEVNM